MNLINRAINWINREGQRTGIGPIGVLILAVLAFGVGVLLMTFLSPVVLILILGAIAIYYIVRR